MQIGKDELVGNTKFIPEVVYEDEAVMVINKPYGMLVHEDWTSGTEGTVVEWFLNKVPNAFGVGENTEKP
ncbi:MAG: hypothetical protein KBC78_02950, partial [Candidatus Pacebacteria bacterium]|nr:hypothetical protein [Candidatus Paceibacterota bacterium]